MSDINNRLLEMYLANGATSKNISMAERECLISQGAADGTWCSYLASQGYTGSVNDMMYKFLGDKGYTAQGLNERWMQAALGGGLFGFDWTQFFGVGDDGFVFDGTQSRFYVNSDGPAGVSPERCSASGTSPVGWVEDVSGKGRHATQATSGSKPVFYDDGVKSVLVGQVEAAGRTLSVGGSSITITNATRYTVYALGSTFLYPYPSTVSTGGGPIRHGYRDGTDDRYSLQLNTLNMYGTGIVLGTGDKIASRLVKTGNGFAAHSKPFPLAFSGGSTGSFTKAGMDSVTGVTIGYASTDPVRNCFEFCINRLLTAEETAAVEAQIVSAFGGWV